MRLFDKKRSQTGENFSLKGGVVDVKIGKILSSVVFGWQGGCSTVVEMAF